MNLEQCSVRVTVRLCAKYGHMKEEGETRNMRESDARAAQLEHFGLLGGLRVRVRQRRRRALFAHDAQELAAAAFAAVLVARPDADQLRERRKEKTQ